ncbi:MAG: 3-phosphoshikimate 1-carboxyvinyltransferase, partial [Actinobacteria bacterium]|nr:3-phosphoshikimate 1-carboxyvinyltransferase [Actinomycetota bacterium]
MTETGREQLIQVPGSKSIANRALICAALANSSSTITNCAPGDDTQAMFEALKILGVATVQDGTTVRVDSQINLEDTQPLELQTRLAGTTSRFLTALCALRIGQTTIDGYAPLRKRPMTGLHDALSALGASVKSLDIAGHLPVSVQRGSSWQARIAIDSTT